MTGGEVAALIASVLSMAVGVGAIVLSFVLFRWSAKAREEAKEMSINTQNTIDNMKEQWDEFRAEIFGLFRESYVKLSDRAFADPGVAQPGGADEAEKVVEQKISDLSAELTDKLTDVLREHEQATRELVERDRGKTSTELRQVTEAISELMRQGLTEAAEAERESRPEAMDAAIMDCLRLRVGPFTLGALSRVCGPPLGTRLSVREVAASLHRLTRSGQVRRQDDGRGGAGYVLARARDDEAASEGEQASDE